MIEEHKLLHELVNLMVADDGVEMMALQRLTQRAEALLEQQNEFAFVKVNPITVAAIRGHLADIVNPRTPYRKTHLEMCQYIIEDNIEAAQCAWADLEMIVS